MLCKHAPVTFCNSCCCSPSAVTTACAACSAPFCTARAACQNTHRMQSTARPAALLQLAAQAASVTPAGRAAPPQQIILPVAAVTSQTLPLILPPINHFHSFSHQSITSTHSFAHQSLPLILSPINHFHSFFHQSITSTHSFTNQSLQLILSPVNHFPSFFYCKLKY